MADPKASAGTSGDTTASIQEYKKSQARVRELVEKRRQLERRLNQVEDSIATKETMYLDSTPAGNIITGFDNYMKGATSGASSRRKPAAAEANRVFSRSSISYRPNNGDTPGSTPASHAPTPVSTSFRESASAQPTPTSATAAKGAAANKLKKKETAEDSETDGQGNKKRTNFGAARK